MGRIAGVSPDQTRERLLDAAARVFELKGYEGATIAQIARGGFVLNIIGIGLITFFCYWVGGFALGLQF